MNHRGVHFQEAQIPVTEAKTQLTDLVRRAEAGEKITLTRHGHPAVRLIPAKAVADLAIRRRSLEAISVGGTAKAAPSPGAARSADFLFGEDGLPG